MMATPATTGCTTWRTACSTRSVIVTSRSCAWLPSWVSMFSTTTTEASTSMPKAIASPPRLIRLAVMPTACISKKVASSDSGSDTATTSAARTPPRKR